MNDERRNELLKAFSESVEVWQSPADLRLLGLRMDAETLERHGPGHRVSSETGEIRYSAAWLSDENASPPIANRPSVGRSAEDVAAGESLKPLGNADIIPARRDTGQDENG